MWHKNCCCPLRPTQKNELAICHRWWHKIYHRSWYSTRILFDVRKKLFTVSSTKLYIWGTTCSVEFDQLLTLSPVSSHHFEFLSREYSDLTMPCEYAAYDVRTSVHHLEKLAIAKREFVQPIGKTTAHGSQEEQNRIAAMQRVQTAEPYHKARQISIAAFPWYL